MEDLIPLRDFLTSIQNSKMRKCLLSCTLCTDELGWAWIVPFGTICVHMQILLVPGYGHPKTLTKTHLELPLEQVKWIEYTLSCPCPPAESLPRIPLLWKEWGGSPQSRDASQRYLIFSALHIYPCPKACCNSTVFTRAASSSPVKSRELWGRFYSSVLTLRPRLPAPCCCPGELIH